MALEILKAEEGVKMKSGEKSADILENEKGQVMVLFALALVVLLGLAAFAVDFSMMVKTKAELQNAADAGALAGAIELPSASAAKSRAISYAEEKNYGVPAGGTTVVTPYPDETGTLSNNIIAVTCTKNFQYLFASVLGFTNTDISATAVAQSKHAYTGESLPFLNMVSYGTGGELVIWDKLGSGYFESMWKDDFSLMNATDPASLYFKVFYQDGSITITNGKVANIKQEIQTIYDQKNEYIYLFSLSDAAIASGKYTSVTNKQDIPMEDIVLLKATFDTYNSKEMKLTLTVTDVYTYTDLLDNPPSGIKSPTTSLLIQ